MRFECGNQFRFEKTAGGNSEDQVKEIGSRHCGYGRVKELPTKRRHRGCYSGLQCRDIPDSMRSTIEIDLLLVNLQNLVKGQKR